MNWRGLEAFGASGFIGFGSADHSITFDGGQPLGVVGLGPAPGTNRVCSGDDIGNGLGKLRVEDV